MEVKAIGVIRTPFKQKFATPRQGSLVPSAQGRIELHPHVPEGSLDGLEEFSHLWLLFTFHRNNNSKLKGKVLPPRLQGRSMGWAATRTPHRPNNIGMTLVKLLSLDNKTISVSGIDLVDETPIIDIKPYIANYDCPTAHKQGWTANISDRPLNVSWSRKAQDKILEFSIPQETLLVVEESLAQDPRPPSKRENKFATLIDQWDFSFQIENQSVEILDINRLL